MTYIPIAATSAERYFNVVQGKTRCFIERAFVVLKSSLGEESWTIPVAVYVLVQQKLQKL